MGHLLPGTSDQLVVPTAPSPFDEQVDLVATEPDSAHRIAEETFYPHQLVILGDRMVPQLRLRLRSATLSEGVTLGLIGYGVPTRIECGRLDSGYQVNIPITGSAVYRRADEQTLANATVGAVFTPDDPTSVERASADCVHLGVRISRAYLDDTLERLCRRPTRTPRYQHAYDLRQGARRAWISQVSSILDLLRELPPTSLEALGPQFAQAITVGFLFSADHDLRDDLEGAPSAAPTKVLRRALQAIDEAPAEPIDILSLAELCCVSVRTLQYEFVRHLGMTPSEYRRKVALAGAHRDLMTADPTTETVAAVAARWGFFHQGRFARSYKDRYGSLPAEDLRR